MLKLDCLRYGAITTVSHSPHSTAYGYMLEVNIARSLHSKASSQSLNISLNTNSKLQNSTEIEK